MASWLVPFLPCWVNRDAALDAPLRNILPGIPWSCCSSSDKPRGRFLGPLRCRLAPVAGDDGRESLLRPSDDRQEPIGRALITSSMHSRAARQRNKAFRIGESVETPRKLRPADAPRSDRSNFFPRSTLSLFWNFFLGKIDRIREGLRLTDSKREHHRQQQQHMKKTNAPIWSRKRKDFYSRRIGADCKTHNNNQNLNLERNITTTTTQKQAINSCAGFVLGKKRRIFLKRRKWRKLWYGKQEQKEEEVEVGRRIYSRSIGF